jgi:hypothetical protein
MLSNTNKYIAKSKTIHGDKYCYEKANYMDYHTNVIITCIRHGDFLQTPRDHFRGQGCYLCDISYFTAKAMQIHGDKYSYEKADYINSKSAIIITCKRHGDFLQTPYSHLHGHGCKICSNSD